MRFAQDRDDALEHLLRDLANDVRLECDTRSAHVADVLLHELGPERGESDRQPSGIERVEGQLLEMARAELSEGDVAQHD